MTIAGFVSAIIVGLVVGVLGRAVLPGPQRIGIVLTIAVGIVAALLGTVLARQFDVADTAGVDWVEVLFQVLIAAVGVGLVAMLMGRRATR